MAVRLLATYAKKVGLPGYSSHQFSVAVETELTNVEDVAGESQRLYHELQHAVDSQIQQTGFVPPAEYGMNGNNGQRYHGNSTNGYGHQNGHSPNGHRTSLSDERWNCTEGQKGMIQRLVHENRLDKDEVEALAQQLFGVGVKQANKMQASQLIEELLEKTGKKQNGSRWRGRQGGVRA